ncbi:MAG TPA: hypothetical protein VHE30_17515 [Polyangiaceae bacterium]|nr:hypothetical protein [Polyangiaceae bacterium]
MIRPDLRVHVAAGTLAAALGACTARDTGSIDLASSAEPSASAPPLMPPPGPHPASCATEADCADPAHPRCNVALEKCVECLAASDCEGGLGCGPDFVCRR